MKKNYCDKCGKEIEVDEYHPKNHTTYYFYTKTGHCDAYSFEYCNKCYKKVEEHFKTWHGEK